MAHTTASSRNTHTELTHAQPQTPHDKTVRELDTQVTQDRLMTLAHLGAVPLGTRLITFYKRYTTTYENQYVMLVPTLAEFPDHFVHADDDEDDELLFLQDYEGVPTDHSAVDEAVEGVEITESHTTYDPRDPSHIAAVRTYVEATFKRVSEQDV